MSKNDPSTTTNEVEQAVPETDEEENRTGVKLSPSSSSGRRPRQYIIDRCDGKSKYDSNSRPPIPPCWVPPCVKFLPCILEQNVFCEYFGSIGLPKAMNSNSMRRKFLFFGLASNVIGMILTIVACCAISSSYDTLKFASFSRGVHTIHVTMFDFDEEEEQRRKSTPIELLLHIGLRRIAIWNPTQLGDEKQVLSFLELCTKEKVESELLEYFGDGTCLGCSDVSSSLVSTVIISVITYLPSIFSDVNRMWYNYDVNCAKVFGIITSLISVFSSLSTWANYQNSCFKTFFDGQIPFDSDGKPISPDDIDDTEPVAFVDFNWSAGPGLICIIVATLLKVIDIAAHCFIPTPTIARDRKQQEEYEELEY